MAVRANDLALGDLRKHYAPSLRAQALGDVEALVSEVIELEHQRVGGTPVTLHPYVEDADAVFERAVAAGAKPLRPMEDRFYGDRSGQFEDPYGHRWNVASHIEDVSEEELERRLAAMAGS